MTTNENLLSTRSTNVELSTEEFKKLGYELIDRIAELNRTISERPVTTGESGGTLGALLQSQVQTEEEGQDAGAVLPRATDLLFNNSLFNGHPKFWGYVTSSPTPIGILGDLLASAVNANVGAWALSPMATEIEKQTVQWIAQFMGYPANGGLLVSGGNMANYVGFLAAMRAKAGTQIRKYGLRGLGRQLVLYCSKETHTWVQKAADLYGLGTDSIRWVETDPTGKMDTARLEEKINEDIENYHEPFLVIGTAGSVSAGVIDPLDEIAEICQRYDLWFHIDGAYGGLAAALPELEADFSGLEKADSIAVDPHKWLYAPIEAGCALVKDTRYLTDTFSYYPPYYNFESTETNFVDYGPQNSRGFKALKVWLSFQHIGFNGHRQLIREDIRLARYAFEKLRQLDNFQVFTNHLSITTFRFVPQEMKSSLGEPETEAFLDKLNQSILTRIEKGGEYFMSKAIIGGKFTLRMCIVNFRTTAGDIDTLPEFIQKTGREVLLEEKVF
jgi:aromatic-L-amino-acid/L-tryptophan decarboxylase